MKPYLKRQKNDAADAEAICEAVTWPTMRFVPVKSPEQQSVMLLHRVWLMLNRQRTQISNALRSHLSEFRVVAPIGRNGIEQLLMVINDENDSRIRRRFCRTMACALHGASCEGPAKGPVPTPSIGDQSWSGSSPCSDPGRLRLRGILRRGGGGRRIGLSGRL